MTLDGLGRSTKQTPKRGWVDEDDDAKNFSGNDDVPDKSPMLLRHAVSPLEKNLIFELRIA